MSANARAANQSAVTTTSVAQSVSTFVATITEAVEEIDAVPEEVVEEIEASGEAVVEDVADLEDEVTELRERSEDAARDRAETKGRVTTLEEAEDADDTDETPTPEAGETTRQDRDQTPQTPLERTVVLPESMADSELTANQRRARFVARDVMEYTRSVPAGRAIKSSEIGTVLRAGTECRGRSQTVSRVIEFLNDLGGDGVEVVERRGERRVVFTDEAARRLSRLGGPDEQEDHAVVTEAGA